MKYLCNKIYKSALSTFAICILPFLSFAQTSIFVSDQDALNIKSALVSTDGDIKNEGSITGDFTSKLYLNGNRFQLVGDTLSDTFYLGSIYQDNRVGVCYNSNIHLYNDTGYWFIRGSAFTNNRDLWFRNNATWIDNNSTNQFFVNKGLGLIYKPNSGPNITYPVGFDSLPSAYAPIILENFGTPDNFGVRVQRGLDYHYNQPFGTPDSTPILTHAVNNTWIINEEVKGGTRLLYTPIWQASHELPGFFRPESIVAWYSEIDQTWHWEDDQPAVGSDPYSARKIDTLFETATPFANFDYMPVSVGDPVSPLPFEYINIRASWQGTVPFVNATYSFDEQVRQVEILRSLDGVNYTIIDTVNINSAVGAFDFSDVRFNKPNPKGWVYYLARSLHHSAEINSNSASLYYNDEIKSILFPNPAGEFINIYTEVSSPSTGTVQIYATSGELVRTVSTHLDENNYLTKISVSDLAAGVYQAVLTINNQRTVFRFIKAL